MIQQASSVFNLQPGFVDGDRVKLQKPTKNWPEFSSSLTHVPSMSHSTDSEVSFGRPKKRMGKMRVREGAQTEEESGTSSFSSSDPPPAASAGLSSQIHTKAHFKPGLTFDSPEVRVGGRKTDP